MYLEGSEFVEYTPVEAYSVSTFANTIISGGMGDNNVVTQGTRFLWIYNPDSPSESGFTGTGKWYCGVEGTPLSSIGSDEELMSQFAQGIRTNLNYEFTKWQEYVSEHPEENLVNKFILMIYKAECSVSENV